MTKYIHYKQIHLPGVLISDKTNETASGYIEGLEIECDNFDNVLKHMSVTAGVPYDIKGGVVTNDNIIGFKRQFFRCMNTLEEFAKDGYSLRELCDGYVKVFTINVVL